MHGAISLRFWGGEGLPRWQHPRCLHFPSCRAMCTMNKRCGLLWVSSCKTPWPMAQA